RNYSCTRSTVRSAWCLAARSRNCAASQRASDGKTNIVTTRSASDLYVVDSSGWLEYLTEDSKAAAFGHYLEGDAAVLLPSIVLCEVYKHLSKQRGRAIAERFVAQVFQRKVIPLDETIAVTAGNMSVEHR